MNRLFFVRSCFEPNSAPTNRFLSFIEGFSRLGIDVEVVFVLSDRKGSRITKEWPHIKVTYLWDRLDIKNRYLRQISYSFLTRRFIRGLKRGDTVVLFDIQRMMFSLLDKRKDVRVYAERTEHPFAYHTRAVDMSKFVRYSKQLDGLFVISTPLVSYFVEQGVTADKIHLINMTVDPQRFEGLEKEEAKEPYIAYCGTASNNKDGVNELIKAFSFVSKKYPQYKLYIIGKGLTKDDDSGNLSLVESLQLQDKVIFTGVVAADKMPQLLKNAQMLALDRPDNLQAKYGFPTKLGEYLLTGNPVVLTSVGDIPKFLVDGESALIAEPQNAQSFSSKIIWAIEHPKEAAIIGEKGSEVARKKFNAFTESQKMAKILGY